MSKSDKTACKHKHWLSPKSLVCILKPNAEVLSRLSSLVFLTPPTESSFTTRVLFKKWTRWYFWVK